MELAGMQGAFELSEAVAAVAVPLEDRRQVCKVVEVHVRVARVLLARCNAGGLLAKRASSDELDGSQLRMMEVDARCKSFDGVHNQVKVGERRTGHEHVGGHALGRTLQQRGERAER